VSTLLTRDEDNVLLVYFQDVRIIDESRINSLGQELGDLITNADSQRIILNFKNVSFMSSAMIGKLVLFGKKCKTAKVALRMCDINDNVEEVFNLMKLGKVFAIDKTEEAALKNIKKKSWFGG
jgi:anti-sigma B factor antagonist